MKIEKFKMQIANCGNASDVGRMHGADRDVASEAARAPMKMAMEVDRLRFGFSGEFGFCMIWGD